NNYARIIPFRFLRRRLLDRLKWESDPRNRAAMGPPREVRDDREDWKRMRGATWGDAMRRAKGLDD
ncbi:MAG: hypothetical protein OXQ84_17130, partial [bacterium]|nr:hypothetical protein [bacterium]